MKRTFIIASGAYVEPELEAEFGRLPPSFLPLGNRRLFIHQRHAIADRASRILLSLPEGFEPDPNDLQLLQTLGVELIFVPVGLSLGQSLIYVINVAAAVLGPLSILHGDTLLLDLDLDTPDGASVERDPPPGYHWTPVKEIDDRLEFLHNAADEQSPQLALTGYFSLSNTPLFVQSVTRKGGSFLGGLAEYAAIKPLSPLAAGVWFDFGHANTYHRSRRKMTTEREFNRLSATRRSVVKSGNNPLKIEAEARWFEALPAPMRLYAPAYLGRQGEGDNFAYAIEYVHLPTLSDLFVFGRLGQAAWNRIFVACDEFLSTCAAVKSENAVIEIAKDLYLDKTLARLDLFARDKGLDLASPCRFGGVFLPSLQQMARLAASTITTDPGQKQTLIHGDFCFSNILYDVRADMVRVIDPRGLDGAGAFSVDGDIRYDIGKLHHSAIGMYDHIVAGNFRLTQRSPLDFTLELPDQATVAAVGQSFLTHHFAGLSPQQASAPAISVLLFLSMLPLHSDSEERQMALLANAMRLFLMLDRA